MGHVYLDVDGSRAGERRSHIDSFFEHILSGRTDGSARR